MTAFATVIFVSGELADVTVTRSSSCAGCRSRDGCVTCADSVVVTVLNEAGASVGDRVELYTPDKNVNRLSMLTFFLPAALPIAGYAAAAHFFGEAAGYITMAVLFAASIIAVTAVDRRLRGRTATRIVRILK